MDIFSTNKKRKLESGTQISSNIQMNNMLLQHIYSTNNALLSEFNKLHHSISRIESYINHEQQLKDEIDKRDRKIRILERKLEEKNNKYEYYA